MNIQELFPPPATGHVANPKKQLGQEDFMKLLVAQMNNQDPSNPTDNTQFLSQMTQFTMVDGIEKLGSSFSGMASSLYNSQAMQAATLVGREVLTDSNIARMENSKGLHGQFAVPEFASGLNLQVRNAAGNLIKTLPSNDLTPGVHAFSWDGTNERGDMQADGDYIVVASALVNGKQQAVPLQMYSTVEAVTIGADRSSVELQLAGSQRLKLSQVAQYR